MANQVLTLTLWTGNQRRASGISPGAVEETETLSITYPAGFVTTDNPIQGLANAMSIELQETTGNADNGGYKIAWAATAPQCVITVNGGTNTTSILFVIIRNPHSIDG